MTFTLDHDVKITTLVVNAKDIDGDQVEVFTGSHRKDCGANDLGAAFLIKAGNFSYFAGGDLTGDTDQKVAPVEQLVMDDARDVDV